MCDGYEIFLNDLKLLIPDAILPRGGQKRFLVIYLFAYI